MNGYDALTVDHFPDSGRNSLTHYMPGKPHSQVCHFLHSHSYLILGNRYICQFRYNLDTSRPLG